MKIYDNILETVGNTPLVRLNRLVADSKGTVVVKHEAFNPGGSVKDRIAISMLDAAEASGQIKPGGTVIECTSGNTGMGLAIAACVRGYKAAFTMPDKVASEKVSLLRAFGADVHVCPTAVEPDDPRSYYSVAKRLAAEIDGSFYPNQYHNEHNPEAHYKATGPEIWADTDGKITHFVGGMGTGGTISGVAKYLKEQNPDVRVIGADPVGSLYLGFFETGELGEAHTYKIEGIGEDMLPSTMDFSVVDEVHAISDKEAYRVARNMARVEGIFSGSSAGCAMAAALRVVPTLKEGDLMVVLIPDTGERYLSKVYNEEWLQENGLIDSRLALSVGDILARKKSPLGEILTVSSDHTVREAVQMMRENDVSQLPVMEGGKMVGCVRETAVIPLLLEGGDAIEGKISAVMSPPLPTVSDEVSVDEVFELISKQNPAVLVHDKKGNQSILTKWDLIHSVSGKS